MAERQPDAHVPLSPALPEIRSEMSNTLELGGDSWPHSAEEVKGTIGNEMYFPFDLESLSKLFGEDGKSCLQTCLAHIIGYLLHSLEDAS